MDSMAVVRSMRRRGALVALPVALAASLLATLGAQGAVAQSGGPVVSEVECVRACKDGEPRGGSLVELGGRNLGDVSNAYFTGAAGATDLPGKVGAASANAARARVPWEAVTGAFSVGTRGGRISSMREPTIEIAPIPVVGGWRCVRSCTEAGEARPGSLLAVSGVRLEHVESVMMLGGRGRADDLRTSRVGRQRFESFRLRVPSEAKSGMLIAFESDGDRSPRRRVGVAPPASTQVEPGAATGGMFPIQGPHQYGGEGGTRFGAGRGGRSHQGEDVAAACGTPLVAAVGGKVRYAGYQGSAAGYYIVIAGADPQQDYVYMHLQSASRYRTGDSVATGAQIGAVGQTGNATACLLHFELWSAPGWYEGGKPFDPLPQLKDWDRET